LVFEGDWVRKTCADAREQHSWFNLAREQRLAPGLYIPFSQYLHDSTYRVEKISGFPGTQIQRFSYIFPILEQVEIWSRVPARRTNSLESYLDRINDAHVKGAGSQLMADAMDFLYANVTEEEFPPSFCHGDLTLENIILTTDDRLAIIDPNFKEDLYQSFVLDYGKILQSIHSNYHIRFNSCPGADQRWMYGRVKRYLEMRGCLKGALLAEISHIMRLRKYRPENQRADVDSLLGELLASCQLMAAFPFTPAPPSA
jgi:hypothetical protein